MTLRSFHTESLLQIEEKTSTWILGDAEWTHVKYFSQQPFTTHLFLSLREHSLNQKYYTSSLNPGKHSAPLFHHSSFILQEVSKCLLQRKKKKKKAWREKNFIVAAVSPRTPLSAHAAPWRNLNSGPYRSHQLSAKPFGHSSSWASHLKLCKYKQGHSKIILLFCSGFNRSSPKTLFCILRHSSETFQTPAT